MVYLTFFAIPLLVAVGFYLFGGGRITLRELSAQLLAQAVIVAGISAAAYHSRVGDFEIWNGRVASKNRQVVPCSHSYPCRCRSVSCGKDCRTTVCDTCYEHMFDVDWNLRTTNGEGLTIDRVDRQGLREPARWTAVKIGEPTAVSHYYENYIKGAPDSVFREQGESQGPLPAYPGNVYDYYRLDRLVTVGVPVGDYPEWNRELSEHNADLGARKECNMAVVLTNRPRPWFKELERGWIGGKKNDSVLVVGVDTEMKIQWADVMTLAKDARYKVNLREAIVGIGKLERKKVLETFRAILERDYTRKPMDDFEYLKASIRPTRTAYFLGILFGSLIALFISLYMHENDVFGEGWNGNYR